MAATHITTEAAINAKSGLSVDLPVFAMTIQRVFFAAGTAIILNSQWRIPGPARRSP
jgi:hypothetical protein